MFGIDSNSTSAQPADPLPPRERLRKRPGEGPSQAKHVEEGFTAVAQTVDLAPGEMKFVAVERERIVLANVDGEFFALRDVCGHRNAPLSRGRLDGCLIECPLHFATFDMRTGRFVDGPASADVAAYQVRVENGTIYLRR
jgi:3-phenylpropionate/trans-cinnamate dioxygenase ferredoxin component